ncbi:isoprenyl transferase [Legionella israelensis]|uniref:Ditrans,polycis-undecaprenyl-diphosphate synthase ((2E,6E)-farnesyl-diphosphate specific) n=1 Tax=Legionella israelensis TaxID=454 RepID=A0A0W0V7Q0_9GAMM|nr:isoprenyl transferase [Legionella israelensis]KTD15901.1 undecaprenyl pyrophosphate synthase [Legionella israelensis]QBS09309.1 isoprenyl transferase [Legionella israelensis]SCY22154.1 Undecaprenyl pyrophosphate synthetase [Legionella israelensis DSM 19235]STX60204.1 undecaprenyl pyrophosphate synthetase [Legionella israelensis]
MANKLPQHIAIIMDGNGRWAESKGLARIEGHRAGIKTVKEIVRVSLEKRIYCLSLFAFSSENWSRPYEEVSFLMQLFLEVLNHEMEELHHQGVSIRFTGDRSALSDSLQQQMKHAESLTADNQNMILNVAVNYGGKWDLLNAAKKIITAVNNGDLRISELNEEVFARFLDTGDLPEPDLFIRTSGELRISNFFLWQMAYTELYFTEVHWPDFTAAEFEKALQAYSKRQRRYGRLSEVLIDNKENVHA